MPRKMGMQVPCCLDSPKYRKKKLFFGLRSDLGEVFHALAAQKECKILEGHLRPDHVHILVSIPQKLSDTSVHHLCNRK